MHLNAAELVDLAEGARAQGSAPHLASCDACRRKLEELRAVVARMGRMEGGGVPEPSPLVWDGLSARVSDAVAAEGAPRRSWFDVWSWPRVLVPIGAVAAAVILAVALNRQAPVQAPALLPAAPVVDTLAGALETISDPSLKVVAELTDDIDLETARDAGLATPGSAEHAVTHMNDAELRELRRLLREELARSGA
jgi:hypothetical protein